VPKPTFSGRIFRSCYQALIWSASDITLDYTANGDLALSERASI